MREWARQRKGKNEGTRVCERETERERELEKEQKQPSRFSSDNVFL